jgi:hypothetical protein
LAAFGRVNADQANAVAGKGEGVAVEDAGEAPNCLARIGRCG